MFDLSFPRWRSRAPFLWTEHSQPLFVYKKPINSLLRFRFSGKSRVIILYWFVLDWPIVDSQNVTELCACVVCEGVPLKLSYYLTTDTENHAMYTNDECFVDWYTRMRIANYAVILAVILHLCEGSKLEIGDFWIKAKVRVAAKLRLKADALVRSISNISFWLFRQIILLCVRLFLCHIIEVTKY